MSLHRPLFTRPRLMASAIALALLGGAPPARAADGHDAPAVPARISARPPAPAPAPAPASAPAAAEPQVTVTVNPAVNASRLAAARIPKATRNAVA